MIYKYRKPLLGKSEGGFSINNAEGGHVCPPSIVFTGLYSAPIKNYAKSQV